jgi:hypothetical protein
MNLQILHQFLHVETSSQPVSLSHRSMVSFLNRRLRPTFWDGTFHLVKELLEGRLDNLQVVGQYFGFIEMPSEVTEKL